MSPLSKSWVLHNVEACKQSARWLLCQDHILAAVCGQWLSSSVSEVSGKNVCASSLGGAIQHQLSLSKRTEDSCFVYNTVNACSHYRL